MKDHRFIVELHPQLRHDCIVLGGFSLCQLLLMNDANYPWFILVPDRAGVQELFELSEPDQMQLVRESSYLSRKLAALFAADKMNVAVLGNVVPQLHVHHIVRYRTDRAWPAPVWGKYAAEPYAENALAQIKEKLRPVIAGFACACQYQESKQK